MVKVVSVEEAWGLFRDVLKPLGARDVRVCRTLGRVLAQDVIAPHDFPAQDLALRDGYAVRAEDLAGDRKLKVVGVVGAGEVWRGRLAQGQALRVMTGAPIPEGLNAVLPEEDARIVGAELIGGLRALRPGAHIRERASQAYAGETMLTKGTRLWAEELATVSGLGYEKVKVSDRAHVGILPTGSELIRPGEEAREGQLYPSNGMYLKSVVNLAGGRASIDGPIPDESVLLQQAILRNQKKRFQVTTGGTGLGERDVVLRAMEGLGARVLFSGIRMRPGQSTSLYLLGDCPVLALPGGFGAVQLGFAIMVRPALQFLQAEKQEGYNRIECLAAEDLAREPGACRFVEAKVWEQGGQLHTAVETPVSGRSGFFKRSGEGWILIPPGRGHVARGSLVRVLWKGTGLVSGEMMQRTREGEGL
jgi:molybdopterin molybdotransferase